MSPALLNKIDTFSPHQTRIVFVILLCRRWSLGRLWCRSVGGSDQRPATSDDGLINKTGNAKNEKRNKLFSSPPHKEQPTAFFRYFTKINPIW